MKYALAILALISSAPAMAQTTSIVQNDPNGTCVCEHNGKQWPCRHAVDFSVAVQCNANINLKLVCPDDKNELCTYSNQPTCTAPPVMPVCYAADEPKD